MFNSRELQNHKNTNLRTLHSVYKLKQYRRGLYLFQDIRYLLADIEYGRSNSLTQAYGPYEIEKMTNNSKRTDTGKDIVIAI